MIAAQTLTLPNKGLSKAFSSSAFQILAASLFLAFCAQISIPLYFYFDLKLLSTVRFIGGVHLCGLRMYYFKFF